MTTPQPRTSHDLLPDLPLNGRVEDREIGVFADGARDSNPAGAHAGGSILMDATIKAQGSRTAELVIATGDPAGSFEHVGPVQGFAGSLE